MTSKASLRLVTPRDLEILTALDHCPLTAPQLLKWSQTFAAPFTAERRVRERLQCLCDAAWVRPSQYATAGRGAPNYYLLTPLGYRLLHGEEAAPPTKRAFLPVGLAKQHHTQSLADFVVHSVWASHRAKITFTGFYRENTLRLAVGEESLYPDCGFQLIVPGGPELGYLVEIDAGTERIRSPKDLDRFQDSCPKRFRVLVVSTRSRERVGHILDAAATLVRNPRRSLFYGISLPAYLAQAEALTARCFRDHRGEAVALVPERRRATEAADRPEASLAVV
jgi:hypothetical protein